MSEDKGFQERMQQIESLVREFDETADPSVRAKATSLVSLILEFHGAALERVMEMVSQAGDAGERLTERFDRDDLVRGVLLLHGVHPVPMEPRVRKALEQAGPSLASHGASVELQGVADGVIRVRIEGTLHGCGASGVKAELEAAIVEAAPDRKGLVIEGGELAEPASFVPLANLLPHPVGAVGTADRS